MSVLLLFLDGIGCGSPEDNPARATREKLFATWSDGTRSDPVPDGGKSLALDAAMGIPGRPQSGTGHTTILTGQNAPKALGFHLWALPNTRCRELLQAHGLFGILNQRGRRTRFLNGFRPPFFDWQEFIWTHRRWRRYLSATTWANHYAQNPFYDLDDIRAGRAVAHDYTNASFIDAGFDIPRHSPEEAGALIAQRAARFDFAMHEHFETDLIGHRGDFSDAIRALDRAERFVLSAVRARDPDTTIVLCSDHGNLEEPHHRGHTENPAIGFVWGPGQEHADALVALTDIAPWIIDRIDPPEDG